jgi:ribosomal protein S8
MSLQSTDPIADLLTRIRNAALVGKNEIRVPSSKLKEVVAKELTKANYIESVKVESAKPRDILVVKIAKDGEAARRFNELTRMSKPGRRMYVGVEEIPRIKSGRGMVLLSTSKGVMNGFEAKKQRLGGELLLKVW